jgi:hypothetical protein
LWFFFKKMTSTSSPEKDYGSRRRRRSSSAGASRHKSSTSIFALAHAKMEMPYTALMRRLAGTILTPGTIARSVLGVLTTLLCDSLRFRVTGVIAMCLTPVIFPLAFQINAAYQRRETVLRDLANFRAAGAALYFAHRDWSLAAGRPSSASDQILITLRLLNESLREFLGSPSPSVRLPHMLRIYGLFSALSERNASLLATPLPAGPLVARVSHTHWTMMHAFENARIVREYRTPRSINAFSIGLISIIPVIAAPICAGYNHSPAGTVLRAIAS